MKKKIFIIILSVIVALSIPSALVTAYYNLPLDAINYNGYDNGGTTNYSDTYSNDNNINKVCAIILTIFMIILCVFVVIGMIKLCKSTSYEIPPKYMPVDFTSKITKFVKHSDKYFDTEKFISWSKNIFITLQTAWSERDCETIRSIETKELFEQHNAQLQKYIRLGRINCIDNININETFFHKYVRDQNFEHLTVCMKVKMIDYVINEKSGRILKGSKYIDVFITYLLTFKRRKSEKAKLIDGIMSDSCPSCGASINSFRNGKCKYCGNIIRFSEYNWILSDMQIVKPGFKNDNRGIIILGSNNNDNT